MARGETVTKVTRIPESMHRYLKPLAFYRYKTLTRMYDTALVHFLWERPWEEGLNWRKSKATGDGFTQVNVSVSEELGALIKETCEREEVSQSSFLYTALFWFAWYIWPPKTEVSPEWQAYYQPYPSKLLDHLQKGEVKETVEAREAAKKSAKVDGGEDHDAPTL